MNPVVMVSIIPEYGYGDVAFGMKLAARINELSQKGIQKIDIILTAPDCRGCTITTDKIRTFAQPILDQIHATFYSHKEVPADVVERCRMVLLGPSRALLTDRLKDQIANASHQIQTIAYSEYTCPMLSDDETPSISGKRILLTSGPQEDGEGIFIEPQLVARSSNRTPETRIQELSRLSDAPLRESLLHEKTPEEYGTSHELFFGYSSGIDAKIHFSRMIAEKEREKSKDIDIVLVGKDEVNYFPKFLQESSSEFHKNGIAKVKLISQYSNGQEMEQTFPTGLESGKTLRIYIKERLTHDDMMTCMIAANQFCLVTGDQTLSEAISSNGHYIYEILGHKEKLFQGIVNLAEPELAKWLEEWRDLSTDPQAYLNMSERYGALMQKYTPKLQEQFNRLNQKIIQFHNIDNSIQKHVLQPMLNKGID